MVVAGVMAVVAVVDSGVGAVGGWADGASEGRRAGFGGLVESSSDPVPCVLSCHQEGEETTIRGKGRHDPCVLPRAVRVADEAGPSLEKGASFKGQGPRVHHFRRVHSASPCGSLACLVVRRQVPMVEAMVALVLADALMQQEAQCSLFPRAENDIKINPLGKKLAEGAVGQH